MSQISDQFVEALQSLESSREVDSLAALFSDHADIASPLVHHRRGSQSAARSFWMHYRNAFDEIRSSFRTVHEIRNVSILEWRSEGEVGGQSFAYDGVSVVEESDGKITSFRTYFDTRHLPVVRPRENGAVSDGVGKERDAPEGDLEQAQREAAEQRAKGGYS